MLGPFIFAGTGSARPERDLAYCLRNQIAVNGSGRPYAAPMKAEWPATIQRAVLIYVIALRT
jgi:hypothetical protein